MLSRQRFAQQCEPIGNFERVARCGPSLLIGTTQQRLGATRTFCDGRGSRSSGLPDQWHQPTNLFNCAAIFGSGTTKSAPPALTSSPGIPHTTAVASASAIVLPPWL